MALSQNLMTLAKTAGIAAGAMAAFPKVAQAAGAATVESARSSAEFSSNAAAAMQRLDAARFQLQQERAVGTEESTANLVASQIQLERAMAPLSIAVRNIQATVLTEIANLLAELIQAINDLLGIEKQNVDNTMVLQDLLQRAAAGEFVREQPPRDALAARPPMPLERL